MDSNFNNDPAKGNRPPVAAADEKAPTPPAPTVPTVPLSPAGEKFHSCRWRKAAEDGTPDHCTHRDVLPMAGTTGFVPESWCSDCVYYKAKRSPRKRPASDEDANFRW